jgi:hypothetical protein
MRPFTLFVVISQLSFPSAVPNASTFTLQFAGFPSQFAPVSPRKAPRSASERSDRRRSKSSEKILPQRGFYEFQAKIFDIEFQVS